MHAIWVNRIGIVLNFLAGFMIAPELIGIKRIRNWQGTLQLTATSGLEKARTSRRWFQNRLSSASNPWGSGPVMYGCGLLAVLSVILLPIILYLRNFSSTWFLPPLLFVLAVLMTFRPLGPKTLLSRTRYILLVFVPTLLAYGLLLIIFICLAPILLLWYALLVLAQMTLLSVANTLEGNGRLQGIIVSSGVGLYIIGNLLQLIATY